VVVVTWNKKEYVLRLLDSLRRAPYPNWQVTVVDNASTDGTAEAIREQHGWVECVRNPVNLGGTGGFNRGLCAVLKHGNFDYVWLLDDDLQLGPGALEVLVETLQQRFDAGAAGSHMLQLDNPGFTNEIGGMVDLRKGRLLLQLNATPAWQHRDEVYDVDYVAACSLLVRLDVLRKAGIWDDFFIHYDDVDWCLRIREAGYRVLACAASRVYHLSARVKTPTWILYYDIRNILYLQHKHGGFGRLFFLGYSLLLLYYCARDELVGKSPYGRLVEAALRDFFDGRMGRKSELGFPKLPSLAEALRSALNAGTRRRRVLVAVRAPERILAELSAGCPVGSSPPAVTLLLPPFAEVPASGLPDGARVVRLPHTVMGQTLLFALWAVTRRRADLLVADVNGPLGLLVLCARRMLLVVDQNCIEAVGGFSRLLSPLRWVPRALRLLAHYFSFCAHFARRRGCGALTPEAFEGAL
jgi:GT2 family glycosyltransferase